MAKRCMGGYTTTREVYKTVKKYDHQQFDAFFSGMMQSAKEELRDTAPNVKIEKPLPEGQLSIFDLFNI